MAKWIEFCDYGTSPSGKTKVWNVFTKEKDYYLGCIVWSPGWRKYVFRPAICTTFEEDCLRDIANFCEQKTKEHKDRKKCQTSTPKS